MPNNLTLAGDSSPKPLVLLDLCVQRRQQPIPNSPIIATICTAEPVRHDLQHDIKMLLEREIQFVLGLACRQSSVYEERGHWYNAPDLEEKNTSQIKF